ncbi:hypothetical protein U1Q18_003365 [Sarracenia purpurea var. burkii]
MKTVPRTLEVIISTLVLGVSEPKPAACDGKDISGAAFGKGSWANIAWKNVPNYVSKRGASMLNHRCLSESQLEFIAPNDPSFGLKI